MSRPQRDELKYYLSWEKKRAFLSRIEQALEKDSYSDERASTPILSLYYDSPHFHFYHEKHDGVPYRNKVRVRTYDYNFEGEKLAFIEVKKKIFEKVQKIRIKKKKFTVENLDPTTWEFDSESEGLLGKIIERYNIIPAVQVFYTREAYVGAHDSDLRITFDSLITALHPFEDLVRDDLIRPDRMLIPEDHYILEIKATEKIPGWITDIIAEFQLKQTPFSKYTTAVEKLNLLEMVPEVGVYEL
ncbi:MAG: polyphosphate polymerase domain-containing protein [Bacteriovoracaceae bacterium]|nr:polyphosphate polymerase domain-containing protein [Bacteriovoracaceae bacterium]